MALHLWMGPSIAVLFASMLFIPAPGFYTPSNFWAALGHGSKAAQHHAADLFEGTKAKFSVTADRSRNAATEAELMAKSALEGASSSYAADAVKGASSAAKDAVKGAGTAAKNAVDDTLGGTEALTRQPLGDAAQTLKVEVRRHRVGRVPYTRLLPLPGNKPPRSLLTELFAELRVAVRPHAGTLLPLVPWPKSGQPPFILGACVHGDDTLPLENTTVDCPSGGGLWRGSKLLPDARNASAGVVFHASPLGPPLVVDLEFERRGGDYEVVVDRLDDGIYRRMALLAAGTTLMYLAPHLGSSILFYYTSGMSVTILALGLILTYQIIKSLPIVGRKPAFFVSSGAWTLLAHYKYESVWNFLKDLLGPDASLYGKLFLASFLFVGAALGFWAVRRFVLAPNGTLDAPTATFTTVALRFISAVLIWESTVDLPAKLAFEAAAVVLCWSPLPRWVFRTTCWVLVHAPSLRRHKRVPGRDSPSPPGTPPGGDVLTHARSMDPEPTRPIASKPGLTPGLAAASSGRFLTQEEYARQGVLETERQLKGLFGSPEFLGWVQGNQERLRTIGSPRPLVFASDDEAEEEEEEEEEEPEEEEVEEEEEEEVEEEEEEEEEEEG